MLELPEFVEGEPDHEFDDYVAPDGLRLANEADTNLRENSRAQHTRAQTNPRREGEALTVPIDYQSNYDEDTLITDYINQTLVVHLSICIFALCADFQKGHMTFEWKNDVTNNSNCIVGHLGFMLKPTLIFVFFLIL